MIQVRLEPIQHDVALQPGERLLDALEEQAAVALPLACRGAHCGTCRVAVERGSDLLLAPAADEARTLVELGAGEGERLGCQIVARADGRGALVLRLVR